jgi:methyl-accepting chemotaxis protein
VVTLSDSEIRATIYRTIWTAFGLLVGSLVASAVVGTYLVRRGITGPLTRVSAMIQDIAQGEGDLTKRVNVTSTDEIGQLGHWFNTFQAKLHEIVSHLTRTSSRLTGASEGLASEAKVMAQGADEQSNLAGQVASAVDEMSATVTEVARNAQGVAQAARGASEVAANGGEVVSQAVAAMQRIAQAVEGVSRTLSGLLARSDQIGQIVEVIDDIADQTNLLALNAAIEAARAGDQGRGFAVVADEVRRLAERTSRATKEIAEMIHAIQAEASGVATSMESGRHEVETGVRLTGRAGEALSEIIKVVSGVMDQVQQIAAAAEEQTAAAESIASHVAQVAVISKQTAAGAGTTAKATQELRELAAQIQAVVGRFKLQAA